MKFIKWIRGELVNPDAHKAQNKDKSGLVWERPVERIYFPGEDRSRLYTKPYDNVPDEDLESPTAR